MNDAVGVKLARRWGIIFIGIFTFVLYCHCLRYGFLSWDDTPNYLRNTQFRSFAFPSLRWMWTTHYQGPYQPLSWMSAALDYQLWGLRPLGYHLTNILLHSFNAILVFIIALHLLKRPSEEPAPSTIGMPLADVVGALATALFFAGHPLRVESVAWVTERRDVLSGFFFLSSLWAYVSSRDRPTKLKKIVCFAAFVLAILSKITAIGLLWVLIACDVYWKEPFVKATLKRVPWIIVGAGVGLINLLGFRSGELSVGSYGLWDRSQIFLYGVAFYLERTFWPFHLAPYYELPKKINVISMALEVQACVAILLAIVFFRWRQRWPAVWLAWISYVLILLPVSGLLQNGQQIVADRYSYLSCLPWAMILGGGVSLFYRYSHKAAVYGTVAGALFLSVLTWKQIRYWANDESLWKRAVLVSPTSCLAHFNLAFTYESEGQSAAALQAYQSNVAQCPDDAGAWTGLGMLYERRLDWRAAEAAYRSALSVHPSDAEVQNNLALVLAHEDRWGESLALLRRVTDQNPEYAEARFNLGVLEEARGMRSAANVDLRNALQRSPALAQRLPTSLRRKL